MLIELYNENYPLKIGNAELYLRYDMKAFLNIEKQGVDFLNVSGITAKTARIFLRYGLECYFSENEFAEAERNSLTNSVFNAAKADYLLTAIQEAVILALPKPIIGAKSTGGKLDFKQIRGLFCDMMNKPDSLFWGSTLREILERWDSYAIFNGYTKAPIQVKQFDD